MRFVVVTLDVEDIRGMAESIVPKARCLEVGTTYSGSSPYLMYVGIIYNGNMPTVREAFKMIADLGIELEEE